MTTLTIELIAETCCVCGAIFGMTKEHKATLKASGNPFYCPNGHSQYYTQSEAARVKELEKRLKQEEQEREYWRKSYKAEEQEHEGTKRRLSATKGALTKTKKRVANGTCPCCQRTFKQLSSHMANKHPEYVAEANSTEA
jgi:hypothetical protein